MPWMTTYTKKRHETFLKAQKLHFIVHEVAGQLGGKALCGRNPRLGWRHGTPAERVCAKCLRIYEESQKQSNEAVKDAPA